MSMMLLSQWTLWLTKQYCGPPISEQVWQMLTRKVAVFDSVEGFWGVMNHVKLPLEMRHDKLKYYLFKSDIEPVWEHEANASGGQWTIESNETSDDHWIALACVVIGEDFEFSEHICGVGSSAAKGELLLTIWVKDASDWAACNGVRRAIHDALKFSDTSTTWRFRKHFPNRPYVPSSFSPHPRV
ncbi:Eukaryotic translation initiation factor 4E [Plasmodiophora brassicae]|uniref:Eukaryotic translation initiation factor 4E n=1 Tax=Plasmodiophora brassicae TaxID=37360 RepID=A0A0G4ILG7_PLABS|nr:hypothetical protein PBRA_004647 [Plasmodiophora brassicae]SPQ93495.1 unnamed protein product [Plasmodiophora brassicae]